MSSPIPPATALPAGLGNVRDPAQPAVAGMVPPTAAAAAAVPAAVPTSAAMPPATSVQWSAQALQELRLQAFEQLIAQLALQVQAQTAGQPLAPAWPAQGVSAPLQQWLQNLLLQIGVQGQPLQMLAAQPGSAALIQALAQAVVQQGSQPGNVAQASALRTAAALSPMLAAALQAAAPAAASSSPTASAAPAMPPLQNWWVQQGTLLTPQGERGFSLSLQVPVAWAQSMGAAVPAGGSPQVPALRLTWPDSTPLPASGPVALVLQPQGSPAAARTSALLWLEFQSAPLGAAPAAATVAPGSAGLPLFAPAPALAQEVQQLLQNKSDPWLLMAAAQAANALPLPRRGGEHRSHLCATEGCQYQGLAPCAQPFCSEMNRIWAATGVARSG
ncbi:MAG: Fe-S oxidoreductase [Comamonas sp.]|nr:Fe-S oxidoreductase [Comamonas sp.]